MDDPVLPPVKRTFQRGHRDLQLRYLPELLGRIRECRASANVSQALPCLERLREIPVHRVEELEQERIELRWHVKWSF